MLHSNARERFLLAATLLTAAASANAQSGSTTRVSVDSAGNQGNGDSLVASISADGRYVAFYSNSNNLVPGDTHGWTDVFVHDRTGGETTRVSVDSAGNEANNGSYYPSLSADGRHVAYYSSADNLVPGDSNLNYDVFVHDRKTLQTTRVSVDSAGSQGNDASYGPSLSAHGRQVAFYGSASNLVTGDTNQCSDIFVHDRSTARTTRVSVSSVGTQGNSQSLDAAISADGRYVAFWSEASNLVPGDTNHAFDVFVHDRTESRTARASVGTTGGQGNGESSGPAISADGRFVAFYSAASNLVPGDTNAKLDVFVHDLLSSQTALVSVGPAGSQGNGDSAFPAISADGRYVAFHSNADNFVPGDSNLRFDAFVHDRAAGQTTRVSEDSAGNQGNGDSYVDSISADARCVAFSSYASILVPGDTNARIDVFVHEELAAPAATYCESMASSKACLPSLQGIGSSAGRR